MKKLFSFIKPRALFLFVICILANITALLPSFNLFCDIFSHFIYQYFLTLIITTLLFAFFSFSDKKFIFLTIFSILFCIINFTTINSTIKTSQTKSGSAKAFKIGAINVLSSNKNYTKFLKIVNKENPDILILQEINNEWLSNIDKLEKEYKYNIKYPKEDNFGAALYSKFPVHGDIEYWSDFEIPVIKAEFEAGNQNFIIYSIHTLPPINNEYLVIRNEMLKKIQTVIKNGKNVIVTGDLNTTPYSRAYKNYIEKHEIKNAQMQNSVFEGTWNAKYFPFLRIPLDYILTTKDIETKSFHIGDNFNSDHLPIFADIQLAL